VLPRVYLPRQLHRTPPGRLIQELRDGTTAPEVEAFVSSDETFVPPSPITVGPSDGCALESYSLTRIVARCSATTANLAVFTEQYDPGWTATVDGNPSVIVRTNGLSRGVPLPAGHHRIELRYHTPGLWLSFGLGFGALLICLVWQRVQNTVPTPTIAA